MLAFWNGKEYLENEFQTPQFSTIQEWAAARGLTEPEFVVQYGPFSDWTRVDVSDDDILAMIPLASSIDDRVQQLNGEMNAYIAERYDIGTQISFLAQFVNQYTAGSENENIRLVWAWVNQVLAYYYDRKAALQACTTQAELDACIWDFTFLNASDPGVSLGSFFNGSA